MMSAFVGRNTVVAEQLEGYIARVEDIRADKKQLSADEAQVMAEAKAAGFKPPLIKEVVRRRAMKPHERQEAESILDQYLHAVGLGEPAPIHRQVGLINVDIAARESVIEAMKAFVPQGGAITVEAGGRPVRLTRGKDGEVTVAEVEPPAPAAAATAPARAPQAAPAGMRSQPAPDVDADGAEALGRQAFRDNAPVITNPFPFGDARRPRWDEGWRAESGTDGMGPRREP